MQSFKLSFSYSVLYKSGDKKNEYILYTITIFHSIEIFNQTGTRL